MRFIPGDDTLTLQLQGAERFWALTSSITIRREDIVNVRFEPEFSDWIRPEFRLPGTGLPGILVAGSFKTAAGWDFLYLRRPRGYWANMVAYNVVVVETNLKRYQRI